ncbi:MAG: SDR family NAD(P)-dependent oxidoreductase [Gemmatales bacterium]
MNQTLGETGTTLGSRKRPVLDERTFSDTDILGSATRAVTSRIGYLKNVPHIDPADAVVVITGGARGIGEQTAKLFASKGSTVWIGDLDEDVAKATAERIPNAVARRLDVTDRESWRLFVDEVLAEHGRIDVLVNNAGVMPVGPFVDEPEATTDLMLDVNVRGVPNGMHQVLPAMLKAGRGHVVNVSSMAGNPAAAGHGHLQHQQVRRARCVAGRPSRIRRHRGDRVGDHAVGRADRAVVGCRPDGAADGRPRAGGRAGAAAPSPRGRHGRRHRPGCSTAWDLVEAFVPETVERFARRLIGHDQAMALDPVGRKAYLERIGRHADHNASSELRSRAAAKAKVTR